MAIRNTPKGRFLGADAHDLPFPADKFDLTLCHFLLLWVADPAQVVREMRRVTRPGGNVLALAEPDYGGRIDYPPELAQLKALQTQALRRQEADPHLGRKLRGLFAQAGCSEIMSGVLGGQWQQAPSPQEQALEWRVLADDLAGTVSAEALAKLQALAQAAWDREERVLYVPTFYAWGKA